MLRWIDILQFANNGAPEPDRRVEKTDAEWRAQLTPGQYRITRQAGTEPAFSSEMCSLHEPGLYSCVCCGTPLFDSSEKFESGTGWPSFTQPVRENAIAYEKDDSLGSTRVEVTCNVCDAHLGHVFPDGPEPSSLRYCINAEALTKTETSEQLATFGGGCFWCTEAMFRNLKGVISVESGYSGGEVINPTYREVCSGDTGHAEVIQVTYDAEEISFEDLVRIHLGSHDPTTPNAQGADVGTQYRSIVFFRNDEERQVAEDVIEEYAETLETEPVTEVRSFNVFYPAEDDHQDYYNQNPTAGYCRAVIEPKLEKFRATYQNLLS